MILAFLESHFMTVMTASILVVEDDPMWQARHRRKLEAIVGQGNVTLADSYDAVLSHLSSKEFDAYVIDGEFPRTIGQKPEPLGIDLAKYIDGLQPGPKIIRLVSGDTAILDQAKSQEIITYTKGLADPKKGYRDLSELPEDLKLMLGLHMN